MNTANPAELLIDEISPVLQKLLDKIKHLDIKKSGDKR
jgi:hypothetical protein